MTALKVDSVHLSEYELDESIECIFIRFPMPLDKKTNHEEHDSADGDYLYSYDLLDYGTPTYLEIVNYKEAVKNKLKDIPFDFMVEFEGHQNTLRDLLLSFESTNK